jgi:nucleotide-binding universal stress UspA family protein
MPKFTSILFPVDFSDRSQAAAPFVLSMAQRYGSKVVLLHAVQPPPPMYAGMNAVYPDTIDFSAVQQDLMIRLRQFAETELPKVEVTCVVEIGDPAGAIVAYTELNGISLIAMPTHGYGAFRRALLGSVTAKVLHDAKVPVWTSAHAPEPSHRAHPKPRHVLTSLDLKEESGHVLEFALELAAESDATVEIVHVAPEGVLSPQKPEHRMQELLVQTSEMPGSPVAETTEASVEVLSDGNDIAKLVRTIALRKRIDLVVIGRGVITGPFGGFRTHAYGIIREAPCPVLSVV